MTTVAQKTIASSLVILSLSLGTRAQTSGPVKQATLPAQVHAARATSDATVTNAENRLRRIEIGYQQGINSASDISDAIIALAHARIHSANTHHQTDQIPQALKTLLVQNEKRVEIAVAQYKAGVVSLADLNKARIALAETQISSDLYLLVTLREQDLAAKQTLSRIGVASAEQLHGAEDAFTEAHSRFEESQRDETN